MNMARMALISTVALFIAAAGLVLGGVLPMGGSADSGSDDSQVIPGVSPHKIPGVSPHVIPGVSPHVIPGVSPHSIQGLSSLVIPGVSPH